MTATTAAKTTSVWNRTNGSNEWATPRELVKGLAERYGPFGLDCAATQQTAVCPSYFGPDHPSARRRDAIGNKWVSARTPHTARWLNPPYGRMCLVCSDGVWRGRGYPTAEQCSARKHASRTIEDWVSKAVTEGAWRKGTGPLVMLVPARTGTLWFHRHILGVAHEVLLVAGRVRFHRFGEDGRLEVGDPAPFPSLVAVYRGPNPAEQTLIGTCDAFGRIQREPGFANARAT